MGRVGRYKKIKAFDPFSKTGGVVPDADAGKVFNTAPSKRDMERMPKKAARLFARIGVGKAGNSSGSNSGSGTTGDGKRKLPQLGDAASSAAPPAKKFAHMQPLMGESLKSFNRRVNIEKRKQLTLLQQAVPSKTINEKRKRYLNDKKARKRAKAAGENPSGAQDADYYESHEDRKKRQKEEAVLLSANREQRQASGSSSGAQQQKRDTFQPVEQVPFGSRTMEPPRGLPEPRKSLKMRQREAGSSSTQSKPSAAALSTAREAELKTARLQRDRAEVVAAYAELRKQKRIDAGPAVVGVKRKPQRSDDYSKRARSDE